MIMPLLRFIPVSPFHKMKINFKKAAAYPYRLFTDISFLLSSKHPQSPVRQCCRRKALRNSP